MRPTRCDAGGTRWNAPLVTDGGTDDEATIESVLLAADVLAETQSGDDLRLTDEFERVWTERIERMRDGDRALRWLAATRDVDPAALAVDDDDHFAVTHEGDPIDVWHSEAGFLASVVAEPTLREWVPESDLDRVPTARYDEAADRLLAFLERCPTCDGDLAFTDEADDGGTVHVSLDCGRCGATVIAGSFE